MAEEIKPKKGAEIKHGGDVLIVRIIVCVIILLGTMFIRFNNRYIYDSLKFWCRENMLEEKYSFWIFEKNIGDIYIPVKNKVLNLLAGLKFSDK